MLDQSFTFYAGDTTVLPVALTKDNLVTTPGTPWNPGPTTTAATHHLIFTAKRKQSDHDALALFQYTSGAGIVHGANLATVTIHPVDSRAYGGKTLFFDIQAQDISTGDIIATVATGNLVLKRDTTRQTTTSVSVHTLDPSIPYTGPQGPPGEQLNIDGGTPDSIYGNISNLNGGAP